MKVLVIGASGGIGKWFVDYMVNTVHFPTENVIVASRHNLPCFEKTGISFYPLDITQKESFKMLPTDVDAVVHLAGAMPARISSYNPYVYADVNIIGMMNVLEYCRETKVGRILFTTSFGDIKDNAESDILLRPYDQPNFSFNTDHTVYVMSKMFAVGLMRNYAMMYGIKSYVFRLPTIHSYSPVATFFVDGKERPIGYRYLINQIIAGRDVELWGDPNRRKDMIYVKDLCQMLYLALSAEKEFSVYNAGTGVGTTLREQIEGMVRVFGNQDKKSNIILCPEKPNAPQYIMDISNAQSELGYQPRYYYDDMLVDMKKEMELQRFQK